MTVVELYEITRDLSNPFYIFNHRNYKVVCNGEIVTGIQIDDKKGQVILKTYKKENETSEKETKMKDDETLVIISEESDEWYGHIRTCSVCNENFMCANSRFCPGCGRKIAGTKQGNETVFYGKGDEDE